MLDPKQAAAKLAKIAEQKQFSAIVALTMTAKDGQVAAKAELAKQFTLRNTWTERGVRVKPATKSSPFAEVYHMDEHIAQQETGGIRNRKIPFYIPSAIRNESLFGIPQKKIIPTSARAKNMLNKKTFRGQPVYRGRSKNGNEGIFWGRGKERRMLYHERRSVVHLRARPWFREAVDKAYAENIQKNIRKAEKKYVKG